MHRSIRLVLVVLSLALAVGAATALSGCAKSAAKDSSGTAGSSESAAQAVPPTIELVAPAAGSTVPAGDVSLSVKTTGLKFVMPSNTLVPGEGHVHFSLDGAPIEMSTSPDFVYEGVAAGEHKLVAELVQNDTKSFSPPVEQEITFIAE